MIRTESIEIGSVTCDYISDGDWLELINGWILGDKVNHIVTLNPEMVMVAEVDSDFREAVNKATIRVPDGAGLIWARWYLRSAQWLLWPSLLMFLGERVERITGVEAVYTVAGLCEKNNVGMYLLGGRQKATEKTFELLSIKFPKLRLKYARPHEYDLTGPTDILQDISEFNPAVLLVAYGAPKQSLWINQHLSNISSAKVAIGIGGAFEIISENLPRAPKWIRRVNLEWLWRLWLEPKRLPRIKNAIIDFPLLVRNQKKSI